MKCVNNVIFYKSYVTFFNAKMVTFIASHLYLKNENRKYKT
jgi:hypothetical protein